MVEPHWGHDTNCWFGYGGYSSSQPLAGVPRNGDPIAYAITPLAIRQWLATADWADAHGRIEVALHALGDPASRQVLRFDCGQQYVSSSACHNVPEGIAEIAARAEESGLKILGQCHHHPFYSRGRRRDTDEPSFFLSHTDWELLEQLAQELSPATMVFREEFSAPDGDLVLRIAEDTRLVMSGQPYTLDCDPGSVLTLTGTQVRRLAGRAEVFVAVTGSDRLLHGHVLAGKVCTSCGRLERRRIHPLVFEVTDAGPEHDEPAFDQDAWDERLRCNVRRGYYNYRARWGHDQTEDEGDDADGFYRRRRGASCRLLPEELRAELADRLDILANLLESASPEGAVVTELREMLGEYLQPL